MTAASRARSGRRPLAAAAMVLTPFALLATAAGCASALQELSADAPLARVDPELEDPAAAASLLADAEAAWAQRPDRTRVEEAARLAREAALRDGSAIAPVILAARALVWLADHAAGDDEAAALATDAVRTAQACRARDPDHDPCDYWLALAVGVQADRRRGTALDGLDVMVELLRAARATVPELDHGGPDRVLARVLVNAPGWPSGPGDPETGLEHARAALALAPAHAPNHLALAEALERRRQRPEAVAAYREALRLARAAAAAGDPDAPEWIAAAERGLGAAIES